MTEWASEDETDPEDLGWALSPLDGRYRKLTYTLTEYLSEEAMNRARIHVEVEWLIFLSEKGIIPSLEPLTEAETKILRDLPVRFTDARRGRLAELEAVTRHDVKAVEYLVREYLLENSHAPGRDLSRFSQAVHFLCTSEDINNLAHALCVKEAVEVVWLPEASALVRQLREMAEDLARVPILGRTHGQSATPTTLGKELAVFAWRLTRQLKQVKEASYLGKFNGATGTFSAHVAVLPDVDWMPVSQQFVESLGLSWNPLTTQIESHDWQGELYNAVVRFNRVAHNLATDTWQYISMGYFKQNLAAQGSTGSSTMPHKVNPIRFENAEANLELSDAVFNVIASTLSTSRLQRDLSDSSMQRNVGVAFGYSMVALANLRRGLGGLSPNRALAETELRSHWEVLSEAIQQALRLQQLSGGENPNGVDPYEALKSATRGKTVTQEDLSEFLEAAGLPQQQKERLRSLDPTGYAGLAPELAALHPDEDEWL